MRRTVYLLAAAAVCSAVCAMIVSALVGRSADVTVLSFTFLIAMVLFFMAFEIMVSHLEGRRDDRPQSH